MSGSDERPNPNRLTLVINPVHAPSRQVERMEPCARSSTDRASGFYPAGWGFESLRARQVMCYVRCSLITSEKGTP